MRSLDRVRLAEFFPTPLTICTTVFPHLITFCMKLMFNLVRVGKERAGQVFPHPLKCKGYMCIRDRVRLAVFFSRRFTICMTVFPHRITFWTRLMFNIVWVGKDWAGRPSFSPPPKKQRLHMYSWQGKVGCVFRRRLTICTTFFPHPISFCTRLIFNLVRVGKEWASPVFPHPSKKQRLPVYSWQDKVGCLFTQTIDHMH